MQDLISPSMKAETAAERWSERGRPPRGISLKGRLDRVLKSLLSLKISAQGSFGLYTCLRIKAEAVLFFHVKRKLPSSFCRKGVR
jgi:hypothetical protein